MLEAKAIKTNIFKKDMNLNEFLIENLNSTYLENKILAITSKVISVSENRFIKKENISKKELVRKEADFYLGASKKYDCHLTIKEGLLIPSAGIDESNSEEGHFILYPKKPFESAKKIYKALRDHFNINHFGVLLTDSHTSPLRRGVTGVALAYYGFQGVDDKVGESDLFGKTLQMTKINTADALAASATLLMGEGNESCPLAILKYPVNFKELEDNSEIQIDLQEDLYQPILMNTAQIR